MADGISGKLGPVVVLGHRGMLGHVVVRYLTGQGYTVQTVSGRFADAGSNVEFFAEIRRANPVWCVNCIGLRPSPSVPVSELDAVNHRLPEGLSQNLDPGCGLIHASSDAVFASDAGRCTWDSPRTATDPYGASKLEAEASLRRANDWIIRCSIIGPEQGSPKSLFGWFMVQQGVVNGYRNVSWNGITTLQWAKECHAIMRGVDPSGIRVIQPACLPVLSKAKVLDLIRELWGLEVSIERVDALMPTTRWLEPNRPAMVLREQLAELKKWY